MQTSIDYIKDLLTEKAQKRSPKTIGLIIAGGLTTYYLINACRRFVADQRKGYTKIPVPKGCVPYFGHFFSLAPPFISKVAKWQTELGPMIYVYIGIRRWLFIGDPYLAHELLSTHGKVTANRPHGIFTHEYYDPQNKGVTFAAFSAQWTKTRAAVIKVIGAKNHVEIKNAVEREIGVMVEGVLKVSERDGRIDLLETGPLLLAAINSLTAVTIGKRASSIDDSLFIDVMKVLETLSKGISSPLFEMKYLFPVFTFLDHLFHRPLFAQFMEKLFTPTYDRIVQEALVSDENCLAKELQKLPYMDKTTMNVTIHDMLFPGHQLLRFSVAWIIIILCCYPNTQQMLQKEVDEFIAVHRRLPTFGDREHLPHLSSMQKECLRYRPVSAMGVPHEAAEDVVCRGYFIPKGTIIAPNMVSIHSNPSVYDQPEKFIPDRFLHQSKSMTELANIAVKNRDVNIFGWGRRTCIGVYMAEVYMFSALVHLLAKCVIEPQMDQDNNPVYPDLDKMTDHRGFVAPEEAVVRVRKRNDALV